MPTGYNPPTSPLDASLIQFLEAIQELPNGYASGAVSESLANEMQVPAPLVEALFVSAKTRSLIRPDYHARGKTRWIVSHKGEQFLQLQRDEESGD